MTGAGRFVGTYPSFRAGPPVPDRDERSTGVKHVFNKHSEELVHDLYPKRSPHVGRFRAWVTSTVERWRKRERVGFVRRECAEVDLVVVFGAAIKGKNTYNEYRALARMYAHTKQR